MRTLTSLIVASLILFSCSVAQASLVAHWRIGEQPGETAGTTLLSEIDSSHDAVISGGPAWQTASLPPVPSGTTAAMGYGNGGQHNSGYAGVLGDAARSVALWVKRTGTTAENVSLVSWGNNTTSQRFTFRLDRVEGYRLRLEVADGFARADAPLGANEWHHVALVMDQGDTTDQVEMYLDGALVGSTGNWHGLTDIAITTANNGSNNVTIAGLQHSDKYNGLVHIDEVRIYDHALSLAEIESLAIVDPVTLTWTGAGDGSSFADEANWDQLPSTGTIDLANLRDHYIIADPTANLPAVSGITFAGGSLSISDGSMNMGTAGINGGGGAAVTVTGGSLANQFFSVNTAVTLGGDGTITLNGGGVPVNASTVDFTSTTAALQFNDETPDAVRTEHLSKFTVNGDPAVEGVNLIITPFNDVLGARVQAIPEPSALALLAVGLSWLVGLRRRS